MNRKLYIQLGKLGDLMNLLPILYTEAQAGIEVHLMVSAKYAPLLDGVSYVKPIIFEGDPSNITGAVIEARKLGIPFVVTQVCGPPEMCLEHVYKGLKPPHAVTESWCLEQYRAAGHWELWRKQPPLVFDKRDKAREDALVDACALRKQKAILVSTSAETCPFPYKRLLMELIQSRFKKSCNIVDLDEVRGERIYDLLGLYDKAKCLVATDSAPLHLARASRVPVVALVNDKPSLWHSAAWRPRHIFHCRYGDFAARAMEMIDAIENLGKPGCQFQADRSKRAFIHAWSGYEVNDDNRERHERAKLTWKTHYHLRNWISCPIEFGSRGRDSKFSTVGDATRFPFVKDAIQAASFRSKEDDVIVLTPADVSFNGNLDSIQHFPAFGLRTERRSIGDTHNPRVDFLAFTKSWWSENRGEYPDMVMGPDGYWSQTLKELIRLKGGLQVENAVYREEKE